MKTHLECLPCTLNSYIRLADSRVIPDDRKEELMRKLLAFLSESDFKQSPPVMGREMHRMIRESLNNPDPYREIKFKYNRMLMELYPEFRKWVAESDDPFDTAMRLAIGGNVIDFGAKYQFDVMETIKGALEAKLSIDDSRELKQALKGAKNILYVGDNCGEIVLDKLFLEQIGAERKTFVVRGEPIINDITMEDARLVGMGEHVRLITTGDNAPGAVWETSSEEFKKAFREADVVISKGQGNLEGLLDVEHPDLYFLLMTKCEIIAELIGTEKGSYVVLKGKYDHV